MLAEYAALRTEVDRRAAIQWNVLALQLASAGVIASLAISRTSEIALLLVIPLSSYLLGSRYILHDFHLRLISRYIRDSLSGQLQGHLAWESWKISQITIRGGAAGLAHAGRLESAASDPAGVRGRSVACPPDSCAGSRIQLAGQQHSCLGAGTRIRPAMDPRRAEYLFPAQVVQSFRNYLRQGRPERQIHGKRRSQPRTHLPRTGQAAPAWHEPCPVPGCSVGSRELW